MAITNVLSSLQRITGKSASDGELLRRFVNARDTSAFETLLRRHGPMVLGVCRRVLNHGQDAEDAFQATFLILVQRGESVQPPERVGAWLHGVALRTARKARTLALHRQARERAYARTEMRVDVPVDDLQAIIDEVLLGLPEYYRDPIVLCDLEGVPQREAARRLGWPEGTLTTRLKRGRKLLGERLSRRGIGVGAAVLSSWCANEANAQVAGSLLTSTLTAAMGNGLMGATPAVAKLTREVIRSMTTTKLKGLTAVFLVLGVLCVGTTWALNASDNGPDKAEAKDPPKAAKDAIDADALVRGWEKEVRQRLSKDPKLNSLIEKHSLALIHSRYLYGAPDGAYRRSAFSFTAENSDPKVHRNEVQLLFHNGRDNGNTFEFNMIVGQRNIVVDLGPTDFHLDFDFLRKVLDSADERDDDIGMADLPAKEGHVYLQRVKDSHGNHFYALFQVVALDPDSRYMAFVWRKLPGGKFAE